MTEQLYRRRAGAPVQVWRVGDGEPPEWVRYLERLPSGRNPEWCLASSIADGLKYANTGDMVVGDGDDMEPMSPEDFAAEYEPLPAPAPDAREALEIAREALRRISNACPDTCDMTVAHGMAAVADEAIVRIGSGWTPTHRHYKGGLYREMRRGLLEADLTPVVIYESEDGRVWVRPMADFEAKMPDGTPRFARIGGGA